MKCQNCENDLTPEDQICPNCGVPIGNYISGLGQQEVVQENEITDSNKEVKSEEQKVIESPVKLKKPKKNKSNIPVIILILIIIGAIGGLIYFYVGENSNLNKNNITRQKIISGGMEVYIPSIYTYQIKENYILLRDDTNEWEAKVENFYSYNFITYKNDPNYIKEKFSSFNYEVINYQAEKYIDMNEDREITMTTFKSVIDNKNIVIGILDIGKNNGIIVSVIRKDNTYDYERLEKLVPILKSATFQDETINNSDDILISKILDREIIEEPIIEEEPLQPNVEAQNEIENILD